MRKCIPAIEIKEIVKRLTSDAGKNKGQVPISLAITLLENALNYNPIKEKGDK